MNLSLIHLIFWSFLLWVGWWARGRYGAQVGQAVAPIAADPEEIEVLKIFRESKRAEQEAAAKKRQEEFRDSLKKRIS